jgi:hypothetical protein
VKDLSKAGQFVGGRIVEGTAAVQVARRAGRHLARRNMGLLLAKKSSQDFLPVFSYVFWLDLRSGAKLCLLGECLRDGASKSTETAAFRGRADLRYADWRFPAACPD